MAGIEDIRDNTASTVSHPGVSHKKPVREPSANEFQLDADELHPQNDPVGWILGTLDLKTRWIESEHPSDWMTSQDGQADHLFDILIRTHHSQRPDYLAGVAASGVTAAEYSEERNRVSVQCLRWHEVLQAWCKLRGTFSFTISGEVSSKARRVAEKRFAGSTVYIEWQTVSTDDR